MASRKSSNSAESTGKKPANTTGCAGRKPGRGASVGFFASVMVSPTRVSATSLMEAVRKPISPGPRASTVSFFGVKTPTRSTVYSAPDDMSRIFWPFFRVPSKMRTSTTTPRYGSYQESTSSAFSGAFSSPFGGGRRLTMASSTSSTPSPVLAETSMASDASRPMTSSICAFTRSGSAAGRSILLSTGMISWSCSMAW